MKGDPQNLLVQGMGRRGGAAAVRTWIRWLVCGSLAGLLSLAVSACGPSVPAAYWVGVNGWLIDAYVTPALGTHERASLPFQYAILGVSAPSLVVRDVAVAQGSSVTLATWSVRRTTLSSSVTGYYITGTLAATTSSGQARREVVLTIRTNHWRHSVVWGSLSDVLATGPQDWLTGVGGAGGTQGKTQRSHIYVEALRNSGASPVKLLELRQAGGVAVASPRVLHGDRVRQVEQGASSTGEQAVAPQANSAALSGFVVDPGQTVTIYFQVATSGGSSRNVVFVPGLALEKAGQMTTQALQPALWLSLPAISSPIRANRPDMVVSNTG